jgi:hypothetical protein
MMTWTSRISSVVIDILMSREDIAMQGSTVDLREAEVHGPASSGGLFQHGQ